MRIPFLFILASFVSMTAIAFPKAATDVIVFTNVTVIPMDSERTLPDHTVVIDDGRIVAVGPSDEVDFPSEAVTIDGTGRYLMPGLAEMHGHIPSPSSPQEFIDNVLFLYVSNGITTVRGMLGWPGQLELREQANSGSIVSPTLYLAGPSFNGGSINSADQAGEKVRQQHQQGWDLLKVHPGLTLAEYDAMASTANELGIRFGGHVPADVGLEHAIEMGQETFDHVDGYVEYLNGEEGPVSETRLQQIVERSREAGVWIVPTMALWEVLWGTAELETLRSFPELKYMPQQTVQQWITTHENRLNNPSFDYDKSRQVIDNRNRILKALNDGGVRILMGTDAPQQFSVPGFSLHRELQVMADAGMTPYEIMVSGTRNVGEYFQNEDAFGTIAPGQRADLVLVNKNPLDDIANISDMSGVMVRGKWITAEDIQVRLDRIAEAYQVR